jgi:RHH-type proline utilization regulon transcriptional repressor/proline dehydrogenase/delta 1-pyrroline-5-carboxylate dehydrogenase
MVDMLEGAMRELALGDPRRLAVDVGPVIDADARERWSLTSQECAMPDCAWSKCRLPAECARGTFVARRSSISAV